MKLSALLLALFVAGCTAPYADAKRSWRVEVTTSGGLAGRGAGDYAIDSGGKVEASLFNGRECAFTTDAAPIEEILATAQPQRWKASYVPENACCDRIEYVLTYDEAGTITTTKWIDDPLPMPADLVALSNAIVGMGPTSIRTLATERCQ